MALPVSLTSLTTREAITDALYRAVRGFDSNDVEFLNSSFIGEDVTLVINGESMNDLTTIREGVFARVGPMDTTHTISNIRIEVKDGAETASLSAIAVAQHCPPGRGKEPDGPKFLAGSEYTLDLVLDQATGLWKIKKWILDILWTQGEPSVMGL
ncbi:uncharacterized protein N7459_006140 [Penicillium hispanicum]|uniref:uncharacterized protein n=1 Tax=Penicillium hispanicum TaxID=1080232 RepID=UPI002540F5DB|nr:uncharacterized protein N7459_006140 [Penicillium hispanicum]KAJ5580155.1 hypothetical protein N7459_006140 [Penicillium hispanicum]